MASPNPKSYETILGEILATFMSKIGVNDTNEGGVSTSFFEAVTQAIYRAQGDAFAIRRDYSVDRATGEALKRIAREENVKLEPARVTTGRVTISDTSFDKIATKIYAGSIAPNVGTTVLKVSDASLMPASGQIYIGRGTPNIEGPISYGSKTQVGGFWELNLSSATTKFHNISESVILAQGGLRNIPAGKVVKAPAAGGAPDINFRTTQSAIILDGEKSISNVPVAADEPGTDANVPRGAIKEFTSPPFIGATVINEQPFITGRNEESDDEIRAKIKRARISKGLGTSSAIKNSTLGIQASDENAKVASNEIFSDPDSATLFLDDGNGYEEKTVGVGLEYIVDSALGGETRFQLATGGKQTSVAKAFLESTSDSPYSVNPNDRLALLVGGILSEHVFLEGNFRSNGFATAYEIVSSINSNPNLSFVARTSNNGRRVVLESKEESNEDLQITTPTTGGDAGKALSFTSNEVQTLRLYKNRKILVRNGRSAVVESANQSDWSNTITTGETLILSVDKTAYITYSFTNSDFLTEGTYSSVSKSNSLQSWVNVINAKITGVTASINGNRIVLTSNLGTKSRASLQIDASSSLVTKGMFVTSLGLSGSGAEADFTLSRNTAQFKLTNPLEAGDSLTAGTEFSNASVSTSPILGGNVTFSNDAYFWFLIDQPDALIINSGVASDTFITVSKPASNIVRYTSSVLSAFSNIQVGDYVVIWSNELNSNNRLEGRINAVTATTFDLKVTPNEYANAVAQNLISFKEGMVFVRTPKAPQKIKISSGTYNINSVANEIEQELIGVTTSTIDDEIITINSKTNDTYGSILVLTFNDSAKTLNLTQGSLGTSIDSHYAYYESDSYDGEYPLFIHSKITNNKEADPMDSYISDFNSDVLLGSENIDPNELVVFLNPFLTSGSKIDDAQSDGEYVQIDSISGSAVNIDDNRFLRRLRVDDRYFVASTFNFSHNDNLVIVLDQDPSNRTFPVPLYRRAIANSTMSVNSNDFRAYDVDSGSTSQFSTYFGNDYSFKNYKALMKARNVIDPISLVNEDAVLFRSTLWGAGGEKFNVGYGYPTSANQPISHVINVALETDIKILLKSGNPVPNQIDGTTEWDITITPNSPVVGVDTVSYTWSGTGTNPAMNTLVSDNYVTVNTNGEFSLANTGTFRVNSATATSFSVIRPNGVAVAENNIANLTSTTVSLYENDDTTAQEMVDYVTNSLSDFLTASLVDDSGLTGAGVIQKSTYEDTNFVSEYISLVDGLNFISSSNLSAIAPNPQFSFKNALSLPNFNTNTVNAYTFNNGEEVRIIPTTSEQISDLISVLAVSGITTLGSVNTSFRNGKLQISSQILGSNGSVQVAGGSANSATALVIGQSSPINSSGILKVSISRSSALGFQAGQYVKVEATNTQKKDTGISVSTNISVHPNTIVTGKTVIELFNKEDQDRYFGQPRQAFKDLSRAFHVEKHGKLVCISWDGITGSDPYFSKNVEINSDNGNISVDFDGSLGVTKYTVTSGTRNFNEVQIGDSFTIANLADSNNNGTFKIAGISSDKKTVAVLNLKGVDAVSASVLSADLTIATEVKEGDTIEIKAPFASLNQGKFRVIRKFQNSIYIENNSAIEERVVVSENLRSLGFNSTTEFDVTIPHNMRITWNGTGLQPTLENAKLGDTLIVGTAFSLDNRGSFMVTKSNKAMVEKFTFTCPPASDILGGQRIHFSLPNGGTDYYGWFDLNNLSTDPAIVGRTGVQFDYTGSESDEDIALIVQTALNAISGVTATLSGNVVEVEFDDFGPALDAENIDVGGESEVLVTQQGSLAFVECANSKAVAESGITITGVGGDVLKSHISSMVFSPYDNTNVGDYFVVSGNILSSSNKGTYSIVEVLDQERIVVDEILSIQNETALSNNFAQVYVDEEKPYVGYKQIHNIFPDPANLNRHIMMFTSDDQFLKINETSVSSISGLGKLNFSEVNRKGLDSYRYNTGLIREANRVVYGDPRDNTTYPGVSAAGAEIFIKPPLFRRIEVSISVRIKTGIPFVRVVEQVRNNISALINSTPIGQSIAISDIISTVNSIQGVNAVSISSPAYSPSSDVIAVSANEKPLIIDAINDVTVSKVE